MAAPAPPLLITPEPCPVREAPAPADGWLVCVHDGPPPLHVPVDATVPRDEVARALWRVRCAEHADLPVVHVRWHALSSLAYVQVLYDVLSAHGVPVHPDVESARRGWLALRPPHPASPPVSEVASVAGPLVPAAAAGAVVAVHPARDLEDLVDQPEEEPVFHHLWVVPRGAPWVGQGRAVGAARPAAGLGAALPPRAAARVPRRAEHGPPRARRAPLPRGHAAGLLPRGPDPAAAHVAPALPGARRRPAAGVPAPRVGPGPRPGAAGVAFLP